MKGEIVEILGENTVRVVFKQDSIQIRKTMVVLESESTFRDKDRLIGMLVLFELDNKDYYGRIICNLIK
ncbi:hypothetical protein [Vibrio harveyi]|uniref:hypothetical protein n=1 Tax=Vibrio harveyi TaxID=669 RepID=UPI0005ED7880|nr:hypothetical protein [Vibrio harveyi]EIK0772775.1 hypothetical protein [Vibrio alginolyticus]